MTKNRDAPIIWKKDGGDVDRAHPRVIVPDLHICQLAAEKGFTVFFEVQPTEQKSGPWFGGQYPDDPAKTSTLRYFRRQEEVLGTTDGKLKIECLCTAQ